MDSNISSTFYYSKEIFDHEKDRIFKKNWHFAGFRSQLENNNDFVTFSVSGVPLVVQNLKGRIRAFLNVCSHRFSILQQDQKGNRPLLCPYHGWAYDENGIPTGIPKRPLFKDFSKDELCDLRLKEYRFEFCGNLGFISVDHGSQTLKEFIGDFYHELATMSESLGNLVDVNSMEIQANWKIIVENTLESYHVGLIHADTFKKLGASGMEFSFTSFHSNWNAGLNVLRTDPANKKIEDLFKSRTYFIDGYKHFLIFPNLLISSTHGASFNFSVIEPISPDTTRFISYVFTATQSPDAKESLLKAFSQTLLEFNRKVFLEDKSICQLVQKGVRNTDKIGVLSLEEKRVHAFQNTYIKMMK